MGGTLPLASTAVKATGNAMPLLATGGALTRRAATGEGLTVRLKVAPTAAPPPS